MESCKSLTQFYEWFKQFKVVEKAVKAISEQEDQQVLWPAKLIKCLIGMCCCAWNPSNNHFGARNWFTSQYWISSMFQKSPHNRPKSSCSQRTFFSAVFGTASDSFSSLHTFQIWPHVTFFISVDKRFAEREVISKFGSDKTNCYKWT